MFPRYVPQIYLDQCIEYGLFEQDFLKQFERIFRPIYVSPAEVEYIRKRTSRINYRDFRFMSAQTKIPCSDLQTAECTHLVLKEATKFTEAYAKFKAADNTRKLIERITGIASGTPRILYD